MRQLLYGLAAALVAYPAASASGQQGSVQVSGAAQTLTGNSERVGDQHAVEPDVGLLWRQPGTRFGLFELELRGTRRGDLPHFGRAYVSLSDVKYHGFNWSFEGGDAFVSPGLGAYRFSNLFTPAITFAGAAVQARNQRTTFSATAGRATAWRNIFGNDPDTLDQKMGGLRLQHSLTDAIDLTARAWRIRTRGLREFTFRIADSRQAGGGVRYSVTPSVQLIADASAVHYRRQGSEEFEMDGSVLVGTNVLLSRGWIQVNASRFSPGELPAINYPLQDRESVYGASEYDVWNRVRAFGGVEAFRTNLDPEASQVTPNPPPRSTGTRGFGGVRVQLGDRSLVTFRVEDGDRISRPVSGGLGTESDTGSWSAEWQSSVRGLTAFTRYARRENVDRAGLNASFTQHDASTQAFLTVSRSTQLFGIAAITRTEIGDTGGNTFWQIGGGTQLQVPRHDLWMRAEANASRNVDELTQTFVPRESFSVGLSGRLARETSISLDVYADRTPALIPDETPWMARSTLRVTKTFSTGTTRVSAGPLSTVTEATRARGTGTVGGLVFADWNANGEQDADEGPLAGIPVRIAAFTTATTSDDGAFSFVSVPAGFNQVGLDMNALPVDYDPPAVAQYDLELRRGDTRLVSFGLIPLGAIHGRIVRDLNANGKADDEELVDGAVVVLDGGMRSEQARGGRFRFDAVRSGTHSITLLSESMPSGAVITGEAEVPISLTRERLEVAVDFVVSLEKRPEVRRVFPPKVGTATPPAAPSRPAAPGARPGAPGTGRPPEPRCEAPATRGRAQSATRYAVQIAALLDPERADALAQSLEAQGYPAYVVVPEPDDNPQFFRVRIGPYPTRAAARRVLARLEAQRKEKPWVVVERDR
jgi:hypothetical protein